MVGCRSCELVQGIGLKGKSYHLFSGTSCWFKRSAASFFLGVVSGQWSSGTLTLSYGLFSKQEFQRQLRIQHVPYLWFVWVCVGHAWTPMVSSMSFQGSCHLPCAPPLYTWVGSDPSGSEMFSIERMFCANEFDLIHSCVLWYAECICVFWSPEC